MFRTTFLGLATVLALGSLASAGQMIADPKKSPPMEEGSEWSFSSEINAGYSYVTGGKTDGQSIDEQAAYASYVLTARHGEGIPIRLGVGWNRFSFGNVAGSRLPNTLQAEYLIAGIDFGFGESIFGRLEVQPGYYSGESDIRGDSFNIPIVIGGTYLVNKDLQFIVGGLVDLHRRYPFIPVIGLRWQATDSVLVNLVLPKPRVEFEVSDSLNLYVGGEVMSTSYRVDGELGERSNTKSLDNAWGTYTELRVGAGATYKTGGFSFDFELGYMAYREMEYVQPDVTVHTNDGQGAFYGGVSLTAKF